MKILGYTYKIVRSKTSKELDNAAGDCDPITGIIRIAKNMPRQTNVSTTLHEIIEAVNAHLFLGLNEKQIRGIEVGLFQALRDAGINIDKLSNVE